MVNLNVGVRGAPEWIVQGRRFLTPRGTAEWMGAGTATAKAGPSVISRWGGRFIDDSASILSRSRVKAAKLVEAPRSGVTPQSAANKVVEEALDHAAPQTPARGLATNATTMGTKWWVGPAKVTAYGGAVGGSAILVGYGAQKVGSGIAAVGQGTGQATADIGGGLGKGVSDILYGVGSGVGGAVEAAAGGTSSGARSLIGPAVLIGGGALLFIFLLGKVKR